MEYYGRFTDEYLAHHGILGMHWGKRRYQNPDGSLTLEGKKRYSKNGSTSIREQYHMSKKDRAYNILKWGTSPQMNMLIVTGLSGSGKSTLASQIAKDHDADVISLDHYYENPFHPEYQSKGFNRYLSKTVPEYSKIKRNFEEYDRVRVESNLTGRDRKLQKEYWDTMDKVRDAMFKYSESMYGKRKVVVEGMQWMDETLFGSYDKKYEAINDVPMIIKSTGVLTSSIRASMRDMDRYGEFANQFGQRVKLNRTLYKTFKEQLR